MRRTDVSVAANAEVAPVVSYGIAGDRGWRAAAGLAAAHASGLNRAAAVVPAHGDFGGWVRPLQRMTGVAALGLGTSRPVTPHTSRLADERSQGLDSAAMRIFAERLKRQGGQL